MQTDWRRNFAKRYPEFEAALTRVMPNTSRRVQEACDELRRLYAAPAPGSEEALRLLMAAPEDLVATIKAAVEKASPDRTVGKAERE